MKPKGELMARLRKERSSKGLVELRLWLTPEQKERVLYTKHYRFGIGFDYTEYDGLRFCKSYKKGRYIAAYIPLYRVLVTISLSRE